MERLLEHCWKPLTVITKRSIFDAAATPRSFSGSYYYLGWILHHCFYIENNNGLCKVKESHKYRNENFGDSSLSKNLDEVNVGIRPARNCLFKFYQTYICWKSQSVIRVGGAHFDMTYFRREENCIFEIFSKFAQFI